MANTFAPCWVLPEQGHRLKSPTFEQAHGCHCVWQHDPDLHSVIRSCRLMATTGVGTGYITQATLASYVALAVAGNAIVTSANGVLTVTYTAATSSIGTTLTTTVAGTSWAPPVGSTLVISGSTVAGLNGTFTVTSATAAVSRGSSGTAVCAAPGLAAGQTSTASGTVTVSMCRLLAFSLAASTSRPRRSAPVVSNVLAGFGC
jgi:hypothetical protein